MLHEHNAAAKLAVCERKDELNFLQRRVDLDPASPYRRDNAVSARHNFFVCEDVHVETIDEAGVIRRAGDFAEPADLRR